MSIDRQTVDVREAKIAAFDNGHSAEMFVTVGADNIDAALMQLRAVCDAVVIDGNTSAFYDTYKDTLSSRPGNFELDGKLHFVSSSVTPGYLLSVMNLITKKKPGVIVFKTFGISEPELRTLTKDCVKKSKVRLGFFPEFMECEVHACFPHSMPQEKMNEYSVRLNDVLRKYTYSYDRISLAERVSAVLAEDGLKLKIAESFTGGAIASAFTELSGASKFLTEALVTYTVSAKNKRLGVPLQVMAEKGVVSGDTVYDMANGLMASGDCDFVIATTGNAGPTAQSGAVGLCFIAIGAASAKEINVFRYVFDGDRDYNIKSGVKTALFLLYNFLLQNRQRMAAARAQAQAAKQQQQNPTAAGQPTE